MKRGEPSRFIGGPWPHKAGFEIKYSINGKVKSEYRKDKVEAQARADYWKAYFENPTQAEEAERLKENTISYWDRMLKRHAEQLLRDPENKALIASARALSQLASEGIKCAKISPPPAEEGGVSEEDLDGLSAAELSALLETN